MSHSSDILSPPGSSAHRRTMSNTSADDSDDDSSPVADINSHLSMSVKDRMNFWRTAEKQSEDGANKPQAPLIQPVHARQPSANLPRIPPSISRSERVEESKERESGADAVKAAAKELDEDGKRDKKASVREAYLQRLQRHQVERAEEQRRRHNAEYGGELDNARHAKHRAQESLQLKITVEKETSAPVSRRTSPATAASTAAAPVPPMKPSINASTPAASTTSSATAQLSTPPPAEDSSSATQAESATPSAAQPSPVFSATPPPASPLTPTLSPASFDLDTQSFSVSPMTPPVPPPRPPPLLSIMASSHCAASHSHSLSQVLPPPVPDHARARSCTTPLSSPSPPPSGSSTSASPSPIESPPSQSPAHNPQPSLSQPAATQPTTSFPAGTDDPAHRQLIIAEIITSEQSYVSSLSTLITVYLHPLKGKDGGDTLQSSDVSVLFGGVELLYNFHMIFLEDLKKSDGRVAKVILKLCDYLKMYTNYLQNYPQAITTFDAQRKNKPFQSFLTDARKKTVPSPTSSTAPLGAVLDLMSYLIMPVQRVPRYELLLRELMRYTPGVHEEREVLEKALTKIQSIAQHINESGRRVEEMQRVMDVQARISGDYGTLLLPHRRLVREGSVQKMKGVKSGGGSGVLGGGGGRRLFVFNDLIIWTSESGRFRGHTRVDGMRVEAWSDAKGRVGFVLREDDSDGEVEVAASRKKPLKEMVFVCASETESEQWRAAISDVCQKAQMQRRSSTLAAAPTHRSERSGSVAPPVPVTAATTSAVAPSERRTIRNRGSGRSTHKQLMDSLKELKGRAGESKIGRDNGEDEEDEEVSRVRRRGSFNSVSMSVSPLMAHEDD